MPNHRPENNEEHQIETLSIDPAGPPLDPSPVPTEAASLPAAEGAALATQPPVEEPSEPLAAKYSTGSWGGVPQIHCEEEGCTFDTFQMHAFEAHWRAIHLPPPPPRQPSNTIPTAAQPL